MKGSREKKNYMRVQEEGTEVEEEFVYNFSLKSLLFVMSMFKKTF